MASLAGYASRGTLSTLIWQLLRLIAQIGAAVVLAWFLLPSDFGLVAMVVSITGLSDVLRDMGLTIAAIQARTISQKEKSNLFWINTSAGLAVSGVVAALAYPIATLYAQPALVPIVVTISVVYLVNAAAAQFRAQIVRDMRFTVMNATDVLPQIVAIATAIVVAAVWQTYWALVIQYVVSAVLGLLLAVLFARWYPSLPDFRTDIRPLLRIGIAATGTQLLGYTTKNADNVAIGAVWGATALGLYSKAFQLLLLPLNQLMAPLLKIALPVLSRLKDDQATYVRYVTEGNRAVALAAGALYALGAGLASPLIEAVLGAQWLPMVVIFQVLTIGGVFRALTMVCSWVYYSRGLTGQQFRFSLVIQPLIMIALLAGLPWGPLGVAIGHSLAYFGAWVATVLWCQRQSGLPLAHLLRDGAVTLVLIAMPIGGLALAAALVITNSWVAIGTGLLLTVAYLSGAYLLIPVVRKEMRLAWKILVTVRRR